MPVLTEAERHALAMRLVGDFEARRFHVELASAELVGGGTITGRVHRDRELAAGPIVVRARCAEAWREAPPRVPIVPANRSMRMPRWHERTLWSEEMVLDGLADAHWAGFTFQLPPDLPPAVEARSVAWRYEIEARRPLRLRPDERALAVPIVPANRSMRMPRWHERRLWSEELVLDGLSEAHWAGFSFRLPPELPPAVEARSVAWRYEIQARRPLRLRPDERAIAVPLGYRAMLLEPGLPVPLRLA